MADAPPRGWRPTLPDVGLGQGGIRPQPHLRRAGAATDARRPLVAGAAGILFKRIFRRRRRLVRQQATQQRVDLLQERWQLGRWRLRGRAVLAPMEQVTDCAFRRLCYEMGASFTWTEMVRAAALLRRNNSTTSRMDTFDSSTPTGVQLLVGSPEELSESLQLIEERAASDKPHWATGIHGIDLNFGCPSPHVINDGLGPAMLNRPQLLREIFERLAEWRSQTSLPIGAIGAKMRLGVNEDEERREVYLRAIRYAKGRLDYVVLHPRNAREESKKSPARWENIRKAKELAGSRLSIIGNGDVFSRSDADRMLRETGCDAVMIARGATKTVGTIFDPKWDDKDASTVASAPSVEARLGELTERFGVRSKIAEYHKESFRRVRARGSRRALRLLWEDVNWWLMKEHRQMEQPVSQEERRRLAERFFHESAQLEICSISPSLLVAEQGVDGVLRMIPLLARVVGMAKQDVHLPSEEAEEDPQQIVIGLSNSCNVMILCDEQGKILRLNVWCARCESLAPESPDERTAEKTKETHVAQTKIQGALVSSIRQVRPLVPPAQMTASGPGGLPIFEESFQAMEVLQIPVFYYVLHAVDSMEFLRKRVQACFQFGKRICHQRRTGQAGAEKKNPTLKKLTVETQQLVSTYACATAIVLIGSFYIWSTTVRVRTTSLFDVLLLLLQVTQLLSLLALRCTWMTPTTTNMAFGCSMLLVSGLTLPGMADVASLGCVSQFVFLFRLACVTMSGSTALVFLALALNHGCVIWSLDTYMKEVNPYEGGRAEERFQALFSSIWYFDIVAALVCVLLHAWLQHALRQRALRIMEITRLKVEAIASESLLASFCDVHCFLDDDLCFEGDERAVASMLMRSGKNSGTQFVSYINTAEDVCRFLDLTRRGDTTAQAINLGLKHGNGEQVSVELFHVLTQAGLGRSRHLIALREYSQDAAPHLGVRQELSDATSRTVSSATSSEEGNSGNEEAFLLFDCVELEIMGASKRLMEKTGIRLSDGATFRDFVAQKDEAAFLFQLFSYVTKAAHEGTSQNFEMRLRMNMGCKCHGKAKWRFCIQNQGKAVLAKAVLMSLKPTTPEKRRAHSVEGCLPPAADRATEQDPSGTLEAPDVVVTQNPTVLGHTCGGSSGAAADKLVREFLDTVAKTDRKPPQPAIECGYAPPGLDISIVRHAAGAKFPGEKKLIDIWRCEKRKVGHFDVAVIGAGSGGLTAARTAARFGARTLLVERLPRLGGDCTWHGCVPSKALIRCAHAMHEACHGARFGVAGVNPDALTCDWPKVKEHISSCQQHIYNQDDSPEILEAAGVEVRLGVHASFVDAKTLQLATVGNANPGGTELITASNFILATGAGPVIPPIRGLDAVEYFTYETIFDMPKLPSSLAVIGGGPIGSELAQAFARLGSKVTLVGKMMPREDDDVRRVMSQVFEKDGLVVVEGRAESVEPSATGPMVKTVTDEQKRSSKGVRSS
ncbi:dus [Symbiodinium natans]|uniref:Dus protein n=1 Tax=Symbiodinium natans TaxID=878477 RepID=A0A812LM82_9DINO|nr:dus [Symbiodinium natans]